MADGNDAQFVVSYKPLPLLPTKAEVAYHEATSPQKQPQPPSQPRFRKFSGLILTAVLSSILLASDLQNRTLSDSHFHLVNSKRASIQIVVQILSTILGSLQVIALCTLINLATRSRLKRAKTSLDGLRFWANLCIPHIEWTLPLGLFLPLLCFVALAYVPAAVWAGAISPVTIITVGKGSINVPQFANISLIREYPSEYNPSSVPQVRNTKGRFAYNVGINLEGSLLFSASTATTIDGSPRQHKKLDSSGFTYNGRSYGVGSAAGISDDSLVRNPLITTYFYQEVGYRVDVNCIYNSSTDFTLVPDGDEWLYAAQGSLPNSKENDPEFSVYIGRSADSIVSIGVAHSQTNGTKYLGITAGSNYPTLNNTQCSMAYKPTVFNVSISTKTRNITVTPLSPALEFDASGNISHVASRQLELISNDQTNLYQSLLGNSLLASVGDYNTSMLDKNASLTEADATLAGLQNSITAMLDDILVGYASAQLVVGNDWISTNIIMQREAIRLGQSTYVYAVFALSILSMLLVAGEACRTRLWKDLVSFDFMDLRDVIIASSRGGSSSIIQWTRNGGNPKAWRIWLRLDEIEMALVPTTNSAPDGERRASWAQERQPHATLTDADLQFIVLT